MSKTTLAFIVILACGVRSMATDIAFYVGAPNPDGWYDVPTQFQDVATIIAETGHLLNDIQQFDDSQFGAFAAWMDENTDDGEMDILWLNGCMPSVLYPYPNLQPDGSRIEAWLDGGNMVINVGDWFGYVSYEQGWWHGANLEMGAANILDLPSSIIQYADNTVLQVTPTGREYLPSLADPVITYRPVVLSVVQPPWEVAAIFASSGGTDDPLADQWADPVVIHNTETGAYVAFIDQAGGGPATWVDRGQVCAEFIANWVMTGAQEPSLAQNPQPADGATLELDATVALRWSAGPDALMHEVYFGSDRDDVAQADPQAQVVYRSRLTGTMYLLSYPFALGGTYYWRIDEVDKAGRRHKGTVWSFTVADYLVVDDFESYDDSCNGILYTWLDGVGYGETPTCEKAPHAGNGTGSLVGLGASSEGGRENVHAGGQSLQLTYINSTKPSYSQIERTFSPAQDWTRCDVNMLTIYLRGYQDNGVQPLYVGLEDGDRHSTLVRHPDPQAAVNSYWRAWNIALSEFAADGVDLTQVRRMMIVVGDPAETEAGGSGILYLDDIRLAKAGTTAGPVARWEFEEGAGTIAFDSAGSHNGTIFGALWEPGKIGTALWFDGIDDYMDCGTEPLLDPPEMTLALWVRPESKRTVWRSLVAKAGSGDEEVDYRIQLAGRGGEVRATFGTGSASVSVSGAEAAPNNEWTHLALTRDGREMALYMNGGERTSVSYSIEPGDGGYPLRMGGPAPYKGKIDDVRLYDRALSPREIEQIAAGQL